jgi:hypothetical protein
MPTLMSAITQPSFDRDHRPGASARITVTSGASRNTPCWRPMGITGFLEDELQQGRRRTAAAPRTNHVRTAAQLHGSPDLAVGVEDVGDEHQQATSSSSDCARMMKPGPDIGVRSSSMVVPALLRRHGLWAVSARPNTRPSPSMRVRSGWSNRSLQPARKRPCRHLARLFSQDQQCRRCAVSGSCRAAARCGCSA